MSPEGFSVDTHLLRELGDLLVGRDSTAILELVKNGYDADATVVRIEAQNLANPKEAVLTVEDNGNGMTADRFRSAFLRIAGRDKEEGDRRSPRFLRAYTGQKGIGRLASQKLAKILEVRSIPGSNVVGGSGPGVEAQIDWEAIDQQQTLHDLKHGLAVTDVSLTPGTAPGTVLTMRSLKRTWTPGEIGKFIDELHSAQPQSLLLGSDSEALSIAGETLLGQPIVRVSASDDPGFELELAGDLASGDDLWAKAVEDFQWCAEIDVAGGRTRYRISPTTTYARNEPLARPYSFEAEADPALRFQARFYIMPGASSRRGPLKGFVRSTSGIRVYLEGFRVLPYAEYGDDWLEIDREYRSGARYYSIDLDESASDDLDVDKREALNAIPSSGYFGAVFLTASGAPDLESLINREGFVPGPTFKGIQRIVRDGVRLTVRVRRSIFNQRDRLNAITRVILTEKTPDPPTSEGARRPVFDPSGRTPFEILAPHGPTNDDDRKMAEAEAAAAEIGAGSDSVVGPSIDSPTRTLMEGFNAARIQLQAVQSLQPELRVLAGVGLQLGAFVHDINGMLASATTIRELLRGLLNKVVDPTQRNTLQVTLRTADELAHTLARQSSYLTDVLSADPRRRRSQVKVRERVDSVLRFLARPLASKGVTVNVEVPPELRTAPMFPAEVTILLSNLFTNAVKNAAEGGNLWIEGQDLGSAVEIIVSNDGTAVNLNEAERWFLPFESTTTAVDDALGQGLGLGLPIVRALTDDYRGDVRFIEPVHGLGTSIRVLLPKKGKMQ
ncbi:sensor histidine kinase [Arthrobacter russicus]|uniref:histidine kinase n=1 Tax=Arthrobacter russicus TaxID=172040 RepID=A0ABU1J8X7_9MICC|nr:ATP-binding protein [Arthrobacter russicus]MDR6268869.1 signal transduction histidine kinase [Arthrobacter russicus]